MNLSDTIGLVSVISGYDENLDPIETKETVPLGKCSIIQNTSAQQTTLNDGKEYIYSYVVVMRKNKNTVIPTEGNVIHITKKDGTIDKECIVKGFVTLRNWVKIWV